LNTWFTAHWFQIARLYDVPPWDLLIFYAPRADARLIVADQPEATPAASRLIATRYVWQGEVRPGMRQQFVTVLLPHAPTRDATPLAQAIEVLADRPGLAAVCLAQGDRCELALLNVEGEGLDLDTRSAGRLTSDARAIYLDLRAGQAAHGMALGATRLSLGTVEILRSTSRKDIDF
jgi:hypothetical protein